MKSVRPTVLAVFALLPLACAGSASGDAPTAESDIEQRYLDPGTRLVKATHIVADVEDDAAFIVFDRKLQRATPDGQRSDLGKVDAGFESLVVSKTRLAYITSSIVDNSSKVLLHVLLRDGGWKEVLTRDFSEANAPYRHPITFLDDDTLAVGNGDEVAIFAADGTETTVKVPGEVSRAYRADAKHLYVQQTDGNVYFVDFTKSSAVVQPKLEGLTNMNGPVWKTFATKSKTWITTDFDGVKIHDTNGRLLRKADLVTAKRRFILEAVLRDDETLLVANASERSQERHVLATYALEDLTRTDLGTLDGMVGELAPTKGGRLFYTFSPKGAAGFNSRVYYGYASKL